MNEFVEGSTMLASAAVAVYFVRFWRQTGDRLFAIFGLAFATFAVNRVLLTVLDDASEGRVYIYLVRLLVFVLIIVAIVDKNRGGREDADPG